VLKEELINIEKLQMMTEQVKGLRLMAIVPYKFKEDPSYMMHVQNPKVLPLTSLIQMSDELEPRKP